MVHLRLNSEEFLPFLYSPFVRVLTRLQKSGRSNPIIRKVAEQVNEILEDLGNGISPDVKLTKHGENRVRHTVKFDLQSHYRLVVWRNAGVLVPLYVGSHKDVDQWLDAKRDFEFTFPKSGSGQVSALEFRKGTPTLADVEAMADATEQNPPAIETRQPLTLIDRATLALLGLDDETLDMLIHELTTETTPAGRTLMIKGLFPGDERKQALVVAVFEHARVGQTQSAIMDILAFANMASTPDNDPDEFLRVLNGWERGTPIVPLNAETRETLIRLRDEGTDDDWMLFLNSAQRKIAEVKADGPARLLGVSGSGKTAVLLHRARTLALRYPTESILVVTLNDSLARYLDHLLETLCGPGSDVRKRVHVRSLYQVCASVTEKVTGHRIRRIDPVSMETPKDSWSDFIEKRENREPIEAILDGIASDSRADGCSPIEYVREELVWIRSGWGNRDRMEYDSADRTGRSIPFPKLQDGKPVRERFSAVPVDSRSKLRKLLKDFEAYMRVGEVYDGDGASVLAHTTSTSSDVIQRAYGYRCVLVDEMQDISTIEMAFLKWITLEDRDGLFLCGDLAQKVFPKHHDHGKAGINFQGGRGYTLRKNYRNTREILAAAHAIVEKFRSDAAVERDSIMDPESAARRGERPFLTECKSRAEQQQFVVQMVRDYYTKDADRAGICIVSHDENTLTEVERALSALRPPIPTLRLSPSAKFDSATTAVRLSHLEDVKGFEFKVVFVMDVSDPRRKPLAGNALGGDILREGLPLHGTPKGEWWRDAFKLYVAMTRAREALYLTYVYNRSILAGPISPFVEENKACDWLGAESREAAPPATSAKKSARPLRPAAQSSPLPRTTSRTWSPANGMGWDRTDANGDRIVWHDK